MEKEIETLTIDIETSGLPAKGADYETDYEKFPRIVELAFKINDEPVESYIINQEVFIIPNDAIMIHGITNEMAAASPWKLEEVISLMIIKARGAKKVIGHNIYFETSIIKANTIRLCNQAKLMPVVYDDLNAIVDKDKRIDTVKKGMAVTKKWPTLSELYLALFNKTFNAHSAAKDCQATYECYIELKRRGLA